MVHNPLAADGRIAPLKGLVLAGGFSRRMGADKAGLEYDGKPQLTRAVALLQALLDDVYVSIRPDQAEEPVRSGFQQIPDLQQESGPGAGILAAHAYNPQSAWLVIACDMPLLTHELLQQLIANRQPQAGITAFCSANGKPEPLCAIYEPERLAEFEKQAVEGKLPGPRTMFTPGGAALLELPEPDVLQSANTPQEFERIRSRKQAG